MAAMMPMIATTISSSMRVKPLVSRIRMVCEVSSTCFDSYGLTNRGGYGNVVELGNTRTEAAAATSVRAMDEVPAYCRAVPPPPGAISASVGAAAVAFQKMVPTVVLPNERLPLVWKVTGTAVATYWLMPAAASQPVP